MSLAVLWLLTMGSAAARRPSRKQVCRRQCGAAIDACVTTGQRKRPCRRRTLAVCVKHGPQACAVVSPTTTTTITFSTTTTTTPGPVAINPAGSWRFVGDVDAAADTCGDQAT